MTHHRAHLILMDTTKYWRERRENLGLDAGKEVINSLRTTSHARLSVNIKGRARSGGPEWLVCLTKLVLASGHGNAATVGGGKRP